MATKGPDAAATTTAQFRWTEGGPIAPGKDIIHSRATGQEIEDFRVQEMSDRQ
jgi:hypothetical protein